MAPRTIRPYHYIAYGLTDILGAGSTAVVAGWILFFYTTFCGLSAVQAASIFAIARLFDAIWSPLIGHVSDGLSATWIGRRFGRRRVFLLTAIPFLPSFALMWTSGHTYLYYLSTYLFFELVYTSVLVPYESLVPEMTDDYKQKIAFSGTRILIAQVSAILAGFLPKLIIAAFGGKDSPNTFLIMAVIFSVLFMAVVLVTYLFSWERETAAVPEPTERRSFFGAIAGLYSNLASTLRIRAFRLHLGMYLGGYISQDIFNATFTYFVVFGLGGSLAIASGMMGSMAFAQLIAVAEFIPLILWFHPAPSYRLAAGLYVLGILGLIVLFDLKPANAALLLYIPVVISGLGRGGLNFIPWNIYTYIADVDEIVTARRREGIFAGVMTFTRKTTQAVAVMAVGLILELGGFMSGAKTQSPTALMTIVILLAAGPILLLVGGMVISLKFKLDKNTHAVLMREIARFKNGEAEPPTAADRKIVEDLTGWPYESLWGKNSVGRPTRRAR
jgi:oligogalacturonide transporter